MAKFISGWTRQPADERDLILAHHERETLYPLPDSWKWETPFVFDQQQLGSCTANAAGLAFAFKCWRRQKPFVPSRLFTYFKSREMEGTTQRDAGAFIRDAMKSLGAGVCDERLWPYDPRKFSIRPPEAAQLDSPNHRATRYLAVPKNLETIKRVLINNLVVFGFDVFESFETPGFRGHKMPTPKRGEKLLGGHAVAAIGYDDKKQCLLIQNSWGAGWEMNGCFWMPYKYVVGKHTDDFWVVEDIELKP